MRQIGFSGDGEGAVEKFKSYSLAGGFHSAGVENVKIYLFIFKLIAKNKREWQEKLIRNE